MLIPAKDSETTIGRRTIVLLLLLLWIVCAAGSTAQNPVWTELDSGLHLGRFKVDQRAPAGDSTITVLRADPQVYDLMILSAANIDSSSRTTVQWSDQFNLVAAINAGMYDIDRFTHIGYMKSGSYVNNPTIVRRDYRSAAAFGPLHDTLPPFRIYDLDETPVENVIDAYRNVVQNIRLIKRPGENRWPKKPEKWSEAALGEDDQGRLLMIFCKSPYTMYDFNELLLSLPINLVCAQHLEGGAEAQMYIATGSTSLSIHGLHASGLSIPLRPIPNVIGIRKKAPSE